MSQLDKNSNPLELLFKVYRDYPLPVKRNVDFIRDVDSYTKRSSFLTEEYPEILTDFADIIGGEYVVGREGQLFFKPTGKRVSLTMVESSSSVRSLLDIGFYLRHIAQRGDLLMMDEPELNLHPKNQRRVARLLARLVNLGIRVFITTHSDYIVKELNTLIMLKDDRSYLKRIAKEEGYQEAELISAEQVKVYIAEKSSIMLDGKNRKGKYQTLVAADIDPGAGYQGAEFRRDDRRDESDSGGHRLGRR